MRVLTWLGRHDPGYSALRRAGRAAIAVPLLFLLGSRVLGNPEIALFGAFGAFAMLLFVDFGGPVRERIQAQVALALAGAVLICLGTLASTQLWLSAVAMAVVAFGVLFAGSVSSVIASSGTSLLLAFVLPVTLSGTAASIGPRLLGWGIAAAVSVLAVSLLWPAPVREPLRGPAMEACRALAARLRADGVVPAPGPDVAVPGGDSSVAALQRTFLAAPYRPTGLSAPARTVVRLVDELTWLDAVIAQFARHGRDPDAGLPADAAAWRMRTAAAEVLDEGAVLLGQHGGDPTALEAALARLADERSRVEVATLAPAPMPPGTGGIQAAEEFAAALGPGFRAQELAYAVATVAGNIALTARAERRTWWQRMLGRQPGGLSGPLAAATERATGFVGPNSVWLRNSIRGAIGLGLAVLLAKLTGVEHSFWVVLGTMSVLRSSALSTGQTALRGVIGTVVGVIVGAAALFVIGANPVVLWLVLPPAILIAGIAPAAISFAAGQAAFTIVLVLLFNVIAPTGWTVGLIRIEDIALGCAVSLVVGVLFWPRGASASLRSAVGDAYLASMEYLRAAVAYGMTRCDRTAPHRSEPRQQSLEAAAASRRLDDAFRTYLTERGTKQRPLAEVSALATGVAGVRLAADAIVELWRGQPAGDGDRSAARDALDARLGRLEGWYRSLSDALTARDPLPVPDHADPSAESALAAAVLGEAADPSGATATAVRIIWTADYLEVVRRLERAIVAPGAPPGA
ncbi:FUSC family protein [Leifsonia sp. fls2-241-R2A-40a]|uniref:FUSC family protein n=1 Tax=Leifsonia sp. fls2-241-R2A-40a TaxID=3040290 RepID=UPI00254E7275|nr:FUSC family protein [Leifsonia sp. fls2-241-R2A-40a]